MPQSFRLPARQDLEEVAQILQRSSLRPDMTPADLLAVESDLDEAQRKLAYAQAAIQSAYNELKRQYQHSWKPIYLELAQDGAEDDAGERKPKRGMSQRDREVAAQVQALKAPVVINGKTVSLQEALRLVERRAMEVEALGNLIDSRHDRLILVASALKTEAHLTSVPSRNERRVSKALWKAIEDGDEA